MIYMNYLRAIAIIFVVISHIGFILFENNNLSFFSFGPYIENYNVFLHYSLYFIGKIGLNIFFIISGFLIVYSGRKYSRSIFLLNRICKIIPVYIISLLLCYLVQYISCKYWNIYYFHNMNEIWKSLLLYDIFFRKEGYYTLGITWTLIIEIIFYILYFMFKPLFTRENLLILSFLYIIFVIITTHLCIIYQNNNLLNSIQYLGVIYGGVMLYFNRKISSILIMLCISLYPILYIYNVKKIFVILSSIFAYIIVLFFQSISLPDSKIVNYIKNISYPLYLVHFVIMCCIYTIAFHEQKYYLYLLFFPMIIIISHIIHLYIEKPLIRICRRIANMN